MTTSHSASNTCPCHLTRKHGREDLRASTTGLISHHMSPVWLQRAGRYTIHHCAAHRALQNIHANTTGLIPTTCPLYGRSMLVKMPSQNQDISVSKGTSHTDIYNHDGIATAQGGMPPFASCRCRSILQAHIMLLHCDCLRQPQAAELQGACANWQPHCIIQHKDGASRGPLTTQPSRHAHAHAHDHAHNLNDHQDLIYMRHPSSMCWCAAYGTQC